MDTNPQSINEVALFLPLVVGSLAIMTTIINHRAAGRGMTLVVTRMLRQDLTGTGFVSDAGTIAGAAMMLLTAHLLEIAVWAAVLKGVWRIPSFRIGLLSLGDELHHSGLWRYRDVASVAVYGTTGGAKRDAVGGAVDRGFVYRSSAGRSRSLPQSRDLFGV